MPNHLTIPNRNRRSLIAAAAALSLAAIAFVPAAAYAKTVAVTAVPIIVDGDTLYLDGTKIRLEGPDTPESFHPRCDAEMVIALKAKQRLRELVGNGNGVTWEGHGHDRYGRVLAKVYASDGHEVGETLITEGLAVRWRPGRIAWLERAQHWCGPDAELPQ